MDPFANNSVGRQINGEADELPDQLRAASSEPSPAKLYPSEVSHPHTHDSDHLIPFSTHPVPLGEAAGAEGMGWPADKPHAEEPSGTPPRTGIGRGE